MRQFLSRNIIIEKANQLRGTIFLEILKLKPNLNDKRSIRKVIIIAMATGICITASAWLTSKSSMGIEYYTYIGFLLSIIVSLLLAPFLLNYAIESAKVRSPGWSYLIGAKVGSWLGLIISLLVGFCSIIVKQQWLLLQWSFVVAAVFLALISGLVVGAIIGLLLVPILRLAVYGSNIVRDEK